MQIPYVLVAVATAPYCKRNVLRQTLAAIKALKANVIQFYIRHNLKLLWFTMNAAKKNYDLKPLDQKIVTKTTHE